MNTSRIFTIKNPYESVDWDSWTAYKANRHTHSHASDARVDLRDMIESYYAEGFDVLAMAEHGIVNKGWTVKPKQLPLLSLPVRKLPLNPLTPERCREITVDGAGRDGRIMLDVPMGIELNAGVLNKNHVNSYFVDTGDGDWGVENDYEPAIALSHKLGGMSQINHPGDWIRSRHDPNVARDPKHIRYFGDLLLKYPSCMGMEILNQNDSPTRHDRILWDGLLEYVIPHGRTVLGLGTSDAHFLRNVVSSYEYIMMPENTVENLKTALRSGTLFTVGLHAHPELGDDFTGDVSKPMPMVTRVTVNPNAQTIALETNGAEDMVEWIAKGEVIAQGKRIDLTQHTDKIGCYVRAQLKGAGGICFTQAFICDDGNMQTTPDTRTAAEKARDEKEFRRNTKRFRAIVKFLGEIIKK